MHSFLALCTGSHGVNTEGTPLWYKGSLLHRIIAGFMIQGGDFTLRNGKGGQSIWGGTFEDEDLRREIDQEGLLVMANRGKNTNGSQFFISLRPCPHLAGKHVVFGKVVRGYDIVEGLSKLPVGEKDVPVQLVTISNCGELELKKAPKKDKKKRSPSPISDRGRSRSRSVSSRSHSDSQSRSRSRSPSPKRHKSKSHRSSKSKSSKSKSSKSKGSKSKSSRPRSPSRTPSPPLLTEAEIALLQAQAKLEAEEIEHRKREEEQKKVRREEDLKRLKERYEREGREGKGAGDGTIYKGRGSMKAPGGGGGGGGGMRGW